MNDEIKARIEAVRRGEVPERYYAKSGYIIPRTWNTVLFNERFSRSTKKNTVGCTNVLTISAQMGLVNQREFYDKDIASEDKSGYFLLQKGDFAYNKSYSAGYPYGAIKQLSKYDEGIVSPLYICFSPQKGTNTDFYTQYFEGGIYNREIYRIAQEGARNHGLLNIAVEDFFAGTLIDPPLAEQQKIAEILSTCDRVIELKQQLLDEKRKQKQWLMQMLLDPNSGVRLPGFSQKWRNVKLGDICTIKTGKLDANAASEHGKYPLFTCSRDTFWIDTYSFDGDAILIAGNGDVGHTKLYSGKFDAYQRTYVLMNFGNLDYRLIKQYIDFTLLPVVYTELQGGAMPYIKLSTLTQLSFSVPVSAKECEALKKVLLSADNEIDALEQELEAWQQKKKALMQLLLTGLVRV